MRKLVLLVALVGCKSSSDNGYAVNLTVALDPGVEVARIQTLLVQVSGAETFQRSFPVVNQLAHGRVTLVYRPALKSAGVDNFLVVAAAAEGEPIAGGQVDVAITPRKSASATVTLTAASSLSDDGGERDGGGDASTVRKKAGEACKAGVDVCETGFCADGICCNSACDDACMACNVAGSEGLCTPVANGVAPTHGSCPALAPTDINKKCSTDGKCDGSGQCRVWAANTPCGDAVCDPATNVFTPAALCDGAGRCVQPPAYNCKPYKCNGTTACYATCDAANNNAECCTDTTLCGGVVNSCVSSSCGKLPLGRACTNNNQCDAPGLCVDGVCCNAGCAGQCEACDADPQQLGTCLPIPKGATPHLTNGRVACDGATTNCAGSCDGTTRTACSYGTQQCYFRSCSTASGHAVVTNDTFCVHGACTPTTTDCTMTAPGQANTVTSCDGTTHDCSYACLAYYANCAHPSSIQTEGCPDPLNTQSNCGSCGNNCTTALVGSSCDGASHSCQCTNGQVACTSASPPQCYTATATNCCRPNGQYGCGCGNITCNHYGYPVGCTDPRFCLLRCDQWQFTCSVGDCGHNFVDTRFNYGASCGGGSCSYNCNPLTGICSTTSSELCSIYPG